VAIVVDAGLPIALAVGDPRAPTVDNLRQGWLTAGEELHAPALLPYEVANALTRLVAASMFPAQRVQAAWQTVMAVPITYHLLANNASSLGFPVHVIS
jgi:hypothetical protein